MSADADQSGSNQDIQNKKLKVSHESMDLSGQMTEPQHNGSSNICFDGTEIFSSSDKCQQRPSSQSSQCIGGPGISNGPRGVRTRNKYKLKLALSEGFQLKANYLTMEKKVGAGLAQPYGALYPDRSKNLREAIRRDGLTWLVAE